MNIDDKKMRKITVKEFFTVMWCGTCQAFKWILRLFGYKGDGKYAKCVWRLFATSSAVIVTLIALVMLYVMGVELYRMYERRYHSCNDPDCYENTLISRNIYFHDHNDGNGYIFDGSKGEKTLKHVAWIAMPAEGDSLVCYSDGKKRGYFNKYTGKVVIAPKYDHAWIFSDGLASVEEDGYIKFIDTTGKVVIDRGMIYVPKTEGYVFHGGYCLVDAAHGELWGLMDRSGKIVLPQEYDAIIHSDNNEYWTVQKGDEMTVLDSDLHQVLPLTTCNLYISENTINMTMPDHTLRKYDMSGTLINDFYVISTRILEYETDEILYRKDTIADDEGEGCQTEMESYHPKATARLRAYEAGDEYEGLMTAEGHIVTMPLYKDIIAIGYDLYLCTSVNYDKLVVNGKGVQVR